MSTKEAIHGKLGLAPAAGEDQVFWFGVELFHMFPEIIAMLETGLFVERSVRFQTVLVEAVVDL